MASENVPTLRVGIMSIAEVSQNAVEAMKTANGVKLVCVGSRDLEQAQQIAAEYGIQQAVGSFDALLDDDTLDAMYIPLPTVLHSEWASQSIAAGKHVLCEKPVAQNAKQVHQMLQQSIKQNVAFMDGVMFVHHERLEMIRRKLNESVIGAAGVRSVSSVLTFRGDSKFFEENVRVKADGDPMGCLGDLGWYSVQLALWAFNYELPVEVRGLVHSETPNGVPTSFSGTMKWADDEHVENPSPDLGVGSARTSTFFCSFTHAMQQSATLAGDEGFIEINDFVMPSSSAEASFTITKEKMVDNDTRVEQEAENCTVEGCVQEVKMWEHFAELVQDKKKRMVWMRACLANQLCIDALLESARNDGRPVKPDPDNLMAAYAM